MEKTKRLPAAIGILKENYKSRKMIFKLAKNDFKTKYAGSYLGIVWYFRWDLEVSHMVIIRLCYGLRQVLFRGSFSVMRGMVQQTVCWNIAFL